VKHTRTTRIAPALSEIRHLRASHVPVMTAEVSILRQEQEWSFVDCTVRIGGHARALLEGRRGARERLDRDPDRARPSTRDRWRLDRPRRARPRRLPRAGRRHDRASGFAQVGGTLATSASPRCVQFDEPGRGGFSFPSATTASTCGWTARPVTRPPKLVGALDRAGAWRRDLSDGEERFSTTHRARDRLGRQEASHRQDGGWPRSCGGRFARRGRADRCRRLPPPRGEGGGGGARKFKPCASGVKPRSRWHRSVVETAARRLRAGARLVR